MIGVPDAGKALFAVDGFSFDFEGIIVDNLFSLLGRDAMTANVIAIGIVPLKSKVEIQISL